MRVRNRKVDSLYGQADLPKGRGIKNFILVSILILLILLAIRFVNLSLVWHLTRLELRNNPMTEIKNYVFLGLSTREAARDRLIQFSGTHGSEVAVVSYYTFLNPLNFLISNPGSPLFIDIGRMAVLVNPGITWIQIFPEDVIEMEWNRLHQSAFFGSSIISLLFDGFKSLSRKSGPVKSNFEPGISYVENLLETTKYLKISAMIYFVLPALLIFSLSSVYGKGFFTSFFYYVGLFFLFDFKRVFVTVPFFWLFRLINGDISSGISVVIAFCFLVVFLILGLIGISNLKNTAEHRWAGRLIFIFVALPLFIRF